MSLGVRIYMIAGNSVPATVLNVAPARRADQDRRPSAEDMEPLVKGAREHGLEPNP